MALTEIQQFFDQFAAEWDYHFKPERRKRLHQIFARNLSFLKGPILDLGCGTGILLEVFKQELKRPPEQIIELDLSLNMLKQVCEGKGKFFPPCFPVQADGQYLPLKSNTMGSVVAFQVFPHFLQPEQVSKEILRVLKPNGYFAVLHLDDHQTLNTLHRSLHPIVQNHQLPPANILQKFFEQHGFLRIKSAEHKGLYFVLVQKPLY
jgi:demethylmenaquinone methyltransferase/2-methoxy-6-polyprenyl-1,4-benzoquinol methylase